MEKFLEAFVIIAIVAVSFPLALIIVCWSVNIIRIFHFVGKRLEQLISEKIDKKFKQLREEIDGD